MSLTSKSKSAEVLLVDLYITFANYVQVLVDLIISQDKRKVPLNKLKLSEIPPIKLIEKIKSLFFSLIEIVATQKSNDYIEKYKKDNSNSSVELYEALLIKTEASLRTNISVNLLDYLSFKTN